MSRMNAGSLMYLLPYVQEADTSKSKPVAKMTKTFFRHSYSFWHITAILLFQAAFS